MLHDRAIKICQDIVHIKKNGIGVLFNGSLTIKQGVINYSGVPDKWMATINTFLIVNHINNGKTLAGYDDMSYLTEQRELVEALYPIGESADEGKYSDEQFLEACVDALSDRHAKKK